MNPWRKLMAQVNALETEALAIREAKPCGERGPTTCEWNVIFEGIRQLRDWLSPRAAKWDRDTRDWGP